MEMHQAHFWVPRIHQSTKQGGEKVPTNVRFTFQIMYNLSKKEVKYS